MAKSIKSKAVDFTPQSLDDFRSGRKAHRNTFKDVKDKASKLQKLACWITDRVGTMGFFLVIFTWTALWLSWNLLAPPELQFDPPMGFVLWLFISNLIQILLMPLIMVGQNIQGMHAEARAEYDLNVNVKAEQEIETILYHLEYQNQILIALLQKQGINIDEILKK